MLFFIPKRKKTISIQGEINRPGIYELLPGEYLMDLISLSGDLKVTAYLERAQIGRIVPFDERDQIGMDRMFTDVNLKRLINKKKSISLQDGDKIQIFCFGSETKCCNIRGSVARPGNYDLGESLTLSQLIIKADSLLGDAYIEDLMLLETKPDLTEELIKLHRKSIRRGF